MNNSAPNANDAERQSAGQSKSRLVFVVWRVWQHIAIPLSYPVFVLGSLLMLLLVPLSMLLFRTPADRTRWLRNALHKGAKLWVGLTEWLQLIKVEVVDRRLATQDAQNSTKPANATASHESGPLLVIANHPSLIDVLLVSAAIPNLCCVLKGNLHYNPLFTLLIRHLDYLPNSDPERMLAEGQARLAAGEHLLIFPEGTRTPPAKPLSHPPPDLRFRLGAAELARRTSARTLPVAIHYRDRYLRKGFSWYQLPPNILTFRLEIGPVLAPLSALGQDPAGSAGQQAGTTPQKTGHPATRTRQKQLRRRINERWISHFDERLTDSGVGN